MIRLLEALRAAGYDVGPADGPDALPGLAARDGDALIHGLIAAGGQDPDWLTEDQLAGNPVRVSAADYRALVRDAARRPARVDGGALGPGARVAVRRPFPRPGRARSCSLRSGRATSC